MLINFLGAKRENYSCYLFSAFFFFNLPGINFFLLKNFAVEGDVAFAILLNSSNYFF